MVCHSRALFSDAVLASDVSGHWVRKTSYMLEKALSYRKEGANQAHFTDIMYEELVSDPMGQLDKIYERYDGISGSLRQKFERADAENPKGKYGRHGYRLSDFGVTREELIDKNRAYLNLFNTLRGPHGN
jgi:hypothetical protein